MYRKNKLLVAILSFLLVLTIGYALFGEKITINGTALARGTFDITSTCTKGYDVDFNDYYYDNISENITEGGFESDTCVANGNTVTFGANLKYPGARRFFTIRLKNSGSINAILDTSNGITKSKQTCYDSNNDGTADKCTDTDIFVEIVEVGFVSSNGTKISAANDAMIDFIDEDTGNVVLSPNEEFVVFGVVEWDENYDTDSFNNVLWNTTSTVTFNFSQATVQ